MFFNRLLDTMLGNSHADHMAVNINIHLVIAFQQVQGPVVNTAVVSEGDVTFLERVSVGVVSLVTHGGITVVTDVDVATFLGEELFGVLRGKVVDCIVSTLVDRHSVSASSYLRNTSSMHATDLIDNEHVLEQLQLIIACSGRSVKANETAHS